MKRPLFYILIPFILGIVISNLIKIALPYLFAGFTVSALACLAFLKKKTVSGLLLYLAIFFLGIALYQNSLILPRDHIANLTTDEPKKVLIKGTIIDDPAISDTPYGLKKSSFILSAAAITVLDLGGQDSLTSEVKEEVKESGWQKAAGLVKVNLYSKVRPSCQFGDELLLEGMLSKPVALRNPGLFDYSKYLAIKNIYSVLKVKDASRIERLTSRPSNPVKALAYRFRRWLRARIDGHFDGYHAALLKSLFIGERAGLGDDIMDDFIKTGTVHVLAISGLNVGLIAGMMLVFFGILRVPKKWNLATTLALLIFYTFAAGANPPIIRAVVMFSVFVIGYLINRDTDLLSSLSFAALLMLFWNPKELFDPSFQLSFVSIAGIIVLCPIIDGFLHIEVAEPRGLREKIARYTMKSISISIAAWLGTSPLIAAYFNIISPVAVIANLIVIPILFVLTLLSILFFVCPVFSGAVFVIENSLFSINHFLASLPFASLRLPSPSVVFLAVYYAFISLLVIPRHRKRFLIALLITSNILIWSGLFGSCEKTLKLTFLDVGQGDSAFVRLPRGGNILIDGGPGGEEDRFDAGRSVVAPYLWNEGVGKIDALVVTHFHEDHLGGIIYILENFKVGCVIDNGAFAGENKLHDEYMAIIKEKNIRRIVTAEGDTIEVEPDVKIFVLNPARSSDIFDSNKNSIALKLVYKDFSCILCADIESEAMARLSSYGKFLRADVMKAPHHGGRIENIAAAKVFFTSVSPEVSIISVGRQNKYIAPSRQTIDIIISLKSTSYDTKTYGAIRLRGDGRSYKIEAQRSLNN